MTAEKTKKIVIVGGGSAGWMAAAALVRARPNLDIELIESPHIASVGVGEASLPGLRNFNAFLGIDEVEFIKKTGATFKLGIKFQNWRSQGLDFFHPFSAYGQAQAGVDFHHYFYQAKKAGKAFELGQFSLSTQMAYKERFAQPVADTRQLLTDYKYAFHFDATLYAELLKNYALARGVTYHQAKVEAVSLADGAWISELILDDGQKRKADLYIDCSGFRAVLIEQALKTGFEDWSHWLPVDRAVVVASEAQAQPSPYTLSTAQAAGWQWRIPLQHRCGNGYVYSSQFCSDANAQASLLSNLASPALGETRLLSFTTGRRKKFWNKNCVALGLASGFIEPLESTSISLIQTGISRLLMFFPDAGFNAADIMEANRLARIEQERIRDFIILHYCLNQRVDGELWDYCRSMPLPEKLKHKIELFRHRGHILSYELESFEAPSWLSIFDGMGVEPSSVSADLMTQDSYDNAGALESLRTSLAQISDKAPLHADFLVKHHLLNHQKRVAV
ncbi:tryptophan halogenase family protein [Agaribacterium haliotis]|uniref:tryptophan halogenase family protein n=1 Tax=Agaribacterium haliotis TaxID=2013869 RepID=UPI000BB59132|nr:tryptophan halogenase family protein [Agaribacterium haliotis]